MENISFKLYIQIMKRIHESLLNFIDDEDNPEENFQNFNSLFNDLKIRDNIHMFKSLLHLIVEIGNNHHRGPNFFSKIGQVLRLFKEDIKKNFSNTEIYYIFISNKRIFLFLIEEKIIIIDEFIARSLILPFYDNRYIDSNYPKYFALEIKPFTNAKWYPKKRRIDSDNVYFEQIKKDLPENFYELRKTGENDNTICKLIRDDLVKEFIIYVNRNNIPLDSSIEESIYETNPFLNEMQTEFEIICSITKKPNDSYHEKMVSLIKYAAFFGSIQIFNYLRLNGVELTQSIWPYAIHGRNPEIIKILEDVDIDEKTDKIFKQCFVDSIKCHHNDIANYFLINFLENQKENLKDEFDQSFKYYNFAFMQDESVNESLFECFCIYDYYIFVDALLKVQSIDIKGFILKINCF